MLLTPELRTVLIPVLGIFAGALLTLGLRYSGKAERCDDKADELNDIRMQMRSKNTLPALDRLLQFMVETNKKEKKGSLGVSVRLYDTERKDILNRLINDIEQTFKNSRRIGEALDSIRSAYQQIGRALYVLVVAALGSLGLIVLDLVLASSESGLMFIFLLDVLFVIFILCSYSIFSQLRIAHSNEKLYQKERKQYLLDEVKIKE
nr:hypothetical protein [Candidatus Njordarchaeota archaeon]